MTKQASLPCIKNKCLLLAVCRNKVNIKCTILHTWYKKEQTKNNSYILKVIFWSDIVDSFPKLRSLSCDKKEPTFIDKLYMHRR